MLETTAGWAVIAGRFALGAELLGSAQRIREATGDKPRPWERAVQETWLPTIGASLDSDVCHAALRSGRQQSWADSPEFAERALSAAVGSD